MADNDFMIDGVVVAPPMVGQPLYEWNKVSIAWNNMFADFVETIVSMKDKFTWEYNYITAEDLAVIENIVKLKMRTTNTNSFSVTSWTPDRGFITKTCYLGTPIQYTPLTSYNGVPGSFKVSFHWVQIFGENPLYTPGDVNTEPSTP